MKKKPGIKRYKETGLPPFVMALLGLIPVFLFGFLLLSFIEEKGAEYQGTQTSGPALDLLEPQMQSREMKMRQNMTAEFDRLNQDTRDQMQRMKTQKSFDPFY